MRLILSLMLVAALATSAFAWQPKAVTAGATNQVVMFYPEAAVDAGASGAESVQIKNTGAGVLTASLWRYNGTSWLSVLPRAAETSGQSFYGVADSTYTLSVGESLLIEDISSGKQPHLVYITRPTSTSFKVLWK